MKRIKKAQAGREIVTERKLMPSWASSNVKGMRGSSGVVDTVARRAAIKRGEFREDPKTGDIYPTKRYYAAKKAQNGKDTTVVATWKRTIGDTAAQKKKADSLGLSTDKAKEALKARIAAKKKQRSGGKTPAWQRKEGKSPSGGLNAKGRASLRAAGHDIKAPQPQGGPRKRSFCARMSGMKKKLTSAKTANDPNSRINKSLRKWKC